jgi:hypothetical protein
VPLLGVTIPTATFFIVAPWLAAVLHVYFHLFLLRLLDALADTPTTVGSLPLGERVPWLVVDWALRRRADRPVTRRPMDGLGSVVTGFLIWLASPLFVAAGPPSDILARADLTAAEIAEKPADWLGRDTADRRFRIGWCRNRGLPPDPCHKPVAPVADPTGAD